MQIEQLLDIIDRPAAWAWIRRKFLPGGVICPVCGTEITGPRALASFEAMDRTYCTGHGSSFRPLGTISQLRGTEWEPEEFVKLLFLDAAGKAPAEIGTILGKSTGCVRVMLDRIAILGVAPTTGQ